MDEGKEPVVEEVQPDKDGKFPETIPWSKYVGIKEAWGRAKEKVVSLEDQLKKAVNTEEFNRVKTELETTKTKLTETSNELNTSKEKSLTEKRAALIARGVPEDKVKGLSEKELDAVGVVLGFAKKPSPDLGGGGGSTTPQSPRERIQRGFEVLHPTK